MPRTDRSAATAPTSPRPTRPESPEAAQRRDQLLALGRTLFTEHAYDTLSIDDIAAAAGISKGLLYHYFPSKRAFYTAVIAASAAELRRISDPDPTLPPLDQATRGIDAYLAAAEQNSAAFRALHTGGIGHDPEIRAICDAGDTEMCARILSGLGIAADDAPLLWHLALRGWLGSITSACLDWLAAGGSTAVPRADLVDLAVRTLVTAVTTAAERAPVAGLDPPRLTSPA